MILGLTGGIASGKSTVSKYLRDKKIPIVDADVISREVVMPGSKGLKLLVEAFGDEILDGDSLNRSVLRKLVFSDKKALNTLNKILHPIIHEAVEKQLNDYVEEGHPIVVFDAPLLLENNLQDMVDILWVVACDEMIQIKRVMVRDDITEKEAKAIINQQMSINEKIKLADVVLYNNRDLETLYNQIEVALDQLK
ncbi:MAG: dephospho-CoA kinase [Clostridia bacterium]|nr:dephospho-CoA kinase [Clostridia bacterium]